MAALEPWAPRQPSSVCLLRSPESKARANYVKGGPTLGIKSELNALAQR